MASHDPPLPNALHNFTAAPCVHCSAQMTFLYFVGKILRQHLRAAYCDESFRAARTAADVEADVEAGMEAPLPLKSDNEKWEIACCTL